MENSEIWNNYFNSDKTSKLSENSISILREFISDLKEAFHLDDDCFSRKGMLTYSVPEKETFGNVRYYKKYIRIGIKYSGIDGIKPQHQTGNYCIQNFDIQTKEDYQQNKKLIFELAKSAFDLINDNQSDYIKDLCKDIVARKQE